VTLKNNERQVKKMPNPQTSDIHINRALTEISIRYNNENLIAKKALPIVPVAKDSDVYFIYGKQNLKSYDLERAAGTRGKQVEFKIVASSAYLCKEYANELQVTDEDRDNADDPIKMDADTTEYGTDINDQDLEIKAASFYASTSNYGDGTGSGATSMVDQPGTKWSDTSTGGDPVNDVETAKDKVRQMIGKKANTLIINEAVAIQLRKNPRILDFYKYTSAGMVSDEELAEFFRVQNLFVGSAIKDTTEESATDTPETTPTSSDVWSSYASAIYLPPNPGLKMVSFAYNFQRKGYPLVKKWREEAINSDWIRVSNKYAIVSIDPFAGFLLTNVI
jgi:hypothetical protein